jgi:DNA-binding XRE family transcriptional regulator
MRRKYNDCQREDGDCTVCSLVNYGRDCHNRPITKLEWSRRMADMTQAELAKKSGVNIRQIQRVELGEAEAGNLTAKNLLAIAGVLGVDAKFLL